MENKNKQLMKKTSILITILALLWGCGEIPMEPVTVSGTASNYNDSILFIEIDNVNDTIHLNADGTFSKEVLIEKPVYPNFRGTRVFAYIWLSPGKSLTVDFDGSNFRETVTFGGELALPNQYLLEKTPKTSANYRAIRAGYEPPSQPADFIRINDSIKEIEMQFLDDFGGSHPELDTAFIRMEKTAIRYSHLANLQNYPSRIHSYNKEVNLPENWNDFQKGVKMDDPWLLTIPDAKYYVLGYVSEKALRESGIAREDTWANTDLLRTTFDVVENEFMEPEMVDAMLYEKLKRHMDARGHRDIEDLVERYLAVVENEQHRQTIMELDEKWNTLDAGQPAPEFTVLDIDGKEHSLSDYRGKYVFIDFWATWCGPCIRQVPFLEEIYHDYQDENIAIMSISVDKKKEDWEGYVREKAHEWLSVHDGTNMNDLYMVNFIPTFVFIGPDGKIINARAPYPQDEELRELFDKYLNQ